MLSEIKLVYKGLVVIFFEVKIFKNISLSIYEIGIMYDFFLSKIRELRHHQSS